MCEYQIQGETKRKFSVAHVVRPGTETTNACLWFTLLSKMPTHKPLSRPSDERDPSRGVLLDLQENWTGRWTLPCYYTLLIQLQPWTTTCKCNAFQCIRLISLSGHIGGCLRSLHFDHLRGSHHGVGSLSHSLITCVLRISPRRPSYQLFLKKTAKHWEDGVIPPESSARDRFCVMCPVERGSPRLLPCCLCHNWSHIGCSYQTHLGRVCPCHVQILDPRRKIVVLTHPYHEDYMVLPTRPTIRPDNKNISAILSIDEFVRIRQHLGGVQPHGYVFSLRNMHGSQQA